MCTRKYKACNSISNPSKTNFFCHRRHRVLTGQDSSWHSPLSQTGPNMPMLMQALWMAVASVPSKHSAFCNDFRRGSRGRLRKIAAQSQRTSSEPVSITSRPDTKALAQKTYLNILGMTKKSALYNVSNQLILMSPNTNKKE